MGLVLHHASATQEGSTHGMSWGCMPSALPHSFHTHAPAELAAAVLNREPVPWLGRA